MSKEEYTAIMIMIIGIIIGIIVGYFFPFFNIFKSWI